MTSRDRRELRWFWAWLAVCTLPFYFFDLVLGSLSAVTRAALPASALMVVVPSIAALAVTARFGGWRGGRNRLGLRQTPLPAWLIAVVPMPLIVLAASATGEGGFGAPGWGVVLLGIAYLAGAAAEELGWTAFVLPRLRRAIGELRAAFSIGAVWAVWHAVPYFQTGYTVSEVIGLCLFSVAFRVVLVRIATVSGDSLWPATLCHALYNIAWSLSPNDGLDYDPWMAATLTALLALGLHAARNTGRTPSSVPEDPAAPRTTSTA